MSAILAGPSDVWGGHEVPMQPVKLTLTTLGITMWDAEGTVTESSDIILFKMQFFSAAQSAALMH